MEIEKKVKPSLIIHINNLSIWETAIEQIKKVGGRSLKGKKKFKKSPTRTWLKS